MQLSHDRTYWRILVDTFINAHVQDIAGYFFVNWVITNLSRRLSSISDSYIMQNWKVFVILGSFHLHKNIQNRHLHDITSWTISKTKSLELYSIVQKLQNLYIVFHKTFHHDIDALYIKQFVHISRMMTINIAIRRFLYNANILGIPKPKDHMYWRIELLENRTNVEIRKEGGINKQNNLQSTLK